MKIKFFVVVIVILTLVLLLWSLLRPSIEGKRSSAQQISNDSNHSPMNNPTNQEENYKNLLFVDQSLEELVTQYNSPYNSFSKAYEYVLNGKLEEAKRSLRTILVDPTTEIRGKLWAWKALRELGESPPLDIRNEVHGVVFEIPINDWVDILAAYSDGRVRYLNGKVGVNGLMIWDATENPHIKPLVMRAINSAKTVVGKVPVFEKHQATSPSVEPRISVLTYGGIYIINRDRTNSRVTDPILSEGTQLFVGLMQEVEKNKQR